MGCGNSFVQRVVPQRMFSTMIATAISGTSYPVRFGEGLSHLAQNDPEGVRQLEGAGVGGR